MKKRITTIFTITVAAVLVSSIAYAAKKKLQTKSGSVAPNISEVDLAADLLDTKDQKQKQPKASETTNQDEKLKDLTAADKIRK